MKKLVAEIVDMPECEKNEFIVTLIYWMTFQSVLLLIMSGVLLK